MTLEETIEHLETTAEPLVVNDCQGCAVDYHQIAEWLKELKDYRDRIPSYEAGYNDAKREIALSGENERAYARGFEDAIEYCKNRLNDFVNAWGRG